MRNVLALLFLTTFLVNCSEVGFDKSAASSAKSTDDGEAMGTIDQPGTTSTTGTPTTTTTPPPSTPTTTTPTLVTMPRVMFTSPPCVRGSNCSVTFKLEAAQMTTVEFNWATA